MLYKSCLHPKNTRGFELLAQVAHADLVCSDSPDLWKEVWDLVWIPRGYHVSTSFPNASRILYGPQNFVLPEPPWTTLQLPFDRSIYTSLSDWVTNVYKEVGNMPMPVYPIPFPVDIDRWTPTSVSKNIDCFVYFKRREPILLESIYKFLNKLGLSYVSVIYGQYNEQSYYNILNQTRFGVWIGTHESQGFAIQEALAMDVPLIVWDVKSMHEEYAHGKFEYSHLQGRYQLKATTTTYWDDTCGLIGTTMDEVEKHISYMSFNTTNYHPRAFVEATLSPKACWDRLQSIYALIS